jgi:hypothetical protein
MRKVKWAYEVPADGYPPGWLDGWAERWDLIVEEVQEAGEGSGAQPHPGRSLPEHLHHPGLLQHHRHPPGRRL